MFEKNIQTDKPISEFMDNWYCHIDTKTTFNLGHADLQFKRRYHVFNDMYEAKAFYDQYKNSGEEFNVHYRLWDNEAIEDIKK
jgi:hypothetical protein